MNAGTPITCSVEPSEAVARSGEVGSCAVGVVGLGGVAGAARPNRDAKGFANRDAAGCDGEPVVFKEELRAPGRGGRGGLLDEPVAEGRGGRGSEG